MNEFVSLYRKYRPQAFSEVVGQEVPLLLLQKAVSDKKPSHAYLFSGGRGIGKTSLARIFAKSLSIQPEDIYELDAASNRGIDEVRALKESVHTMPFSSPYKMYILDEAHMLTKEAANALLKTLEEPPAHVLFVLATTDKEKLPETIHSRCQVISFAQPELSVLARHLQNVASKEGFTLSSEAAEVIALAGRGSFRDALGALEKVLQGSDATVETEKIHFILGLTTEKIQRDLLISSFTRDTKKLFETLELVKSKSLGVSFVYDALIVMMRNLLLLRASAFTGTPEEKAVYQKLSEEMGAPVQSKHIIFMLEKASLLDQGGDNAFTALFVILQHVGELTNS